MRGKSKKAPAKKLKKRKGPRRKAGESRRRVRSEAEKERLRAERREKKAAQAAAREEAKTGPASDKTKKLRERQKKTALQLNALQLSKEGVNKDRWVRRTRHLLIGMIYERLTNEGMDISTQEMTALSRMLADHRHPVAVRTPVTTRVLRKPKCGGKGALPESFEEVVQQVYGEAGAKAR